MKNFILTTGFFPLSTDLMLVYLYSQYGTPDNLEQFLHAGSGTLQKCQRFIMFVFLEYILAAKEKQLERVKYD